MRRSNVFTGCRAVFVLACFVLLILAPSDTALGQAREMELRSPLGDSVSSSAGRGSDREYYGVGTLYRVKREDTGAVRYALMDADSEIMAFLAPSSKIELKKFVGKEIGVTARTFGKQDDVAPHVIVDEVTLMSLRRDPGVALASHQEQLEPVSVPPADGSFEMDEMSGPIHAQHGHDQYDTSGPIYYDNGPVSGSNFGSCMSCNDGSCDSCSMSPYLDSTSCTSCGIGVPCRCQKRCGAPGWLWLRGEYLLWWTDGMDLPPLVSTGPVGTGSSNQVLYGNESILTEARSGFHIDFGGYLGPQRRVAWEGDYFDLGDVDATFNAIGNGTGQILARPFFNVNPRNDGTGLPTGPPFNDAQIISAPGVARGEVTVDSFSRFNGAAGRFKFNCICLNENYFGSRCGMCPNNGPCQRCGYPPYKRIDFSLGYRYYGLREGIGFNELITSQLNGPNFGQQIAIAESFTTRNDFHGGELGTNLEWGWNRWTLEALMRVAIGGTRQQVNIAGNTTINPNGVNPTVSAGGLLAQPSNIGTYTRSDFAMIPEIGTTLGFYLTPRMRFTVGYTLIYWGNVLRPADQIDLNVDPDQFAPPIVTPTPALRPEFAFQPSSFWAQGLNLGLDLRW